MHQCWLREIDFKRVATVQAAAGVPPARIAVQGLCRAGKPGARTPLRPGQLSLRPPLRQRGHPPAASRVSHGYTRTHRHTSLYTRYIHVIYRGSRSAPRLGRPRRRSRRRQRLPGLRGRGAPPPAAQRAGGTGRRSGSHPAARRFGKQPRVERAMGAGGRERPPPPPAPPPAGRGR